MIEERYGVFVARRPSAIVITPSSTDAAIVRRRRTQGRERETLYCLSFDCIFSLHLMLIYYSQVIHLEKLRLEHLGSSAHNSRTDNNLHHLDFFHFGRGDVYHHQNH